jgi:hypothetical protein
VAARLIADGSFPVVDNALTRAESKNCKEHHVVLDYKERCSTFARTIDPFFPHYLPVLLAVSPDLSRFK